MKKKLLWLLLLATLLPGIMQADNFVNLTPRPKQMTVGTGSLTLPREFTVGAANLPAEMAAEVTKFVEAFNQATGYQASPATDGNALIKVSVAEGISEEGYTLSVTPDGAEISASTPVGLYFAFQTVKKILPANVMAGVKDETVTEYALPAVSINDEPRFGYRGFMLDVARHFFTVEEVKRMIDVMAYYKMNRFHWHLSDDQGWRVEIKKYPKLTTVASIAPNSRFTDMKNGQYWINRPYGPYFYTQEELKEVVAYAKEKHIEIIPEIDMPGHFVAALVAYPELSCSPESSRSVWIDGGISSDVLNVANPAAVQFCKDILSELIDIFPYEQIHIGGDECPTSAWESNAECQAMYKELGLTSYRKLQSHFIKEMGTFLKEKGRKMSVWNEAISASGADTKLIQDMDATIYCWTGADAACQLAANLKLNNIFTPWGPYYINRTQSSDPSEPAGAGDGTDDVRKTYNTVPVPTTATAAQLPYYTGVQGTFWTEHVSDRIYMEYLALPRLIAVAEAGWTPQSLKDFSDFQKRMTADTLLLGYNGYNYCRYHMLTDEGTSTDKVMPEVSTPDRKYWYRIVTTATDVRTGRCFELLREGSPLISQYAANSAAAGIVWTNAQAAEGEDAYDYQLWAFEEDASAPGRYALVCKAQPEGSINPTPTVVSTSGRWKYDASTKHYNFILGDNGYGTSGTNYYYSFRSDKVSGQWMNASMAGQGHAVNLYSIPADGNGGLWSVVPLTAPDGAEAARKTLDEAASLLAQAKTYAIEEEKRPGLFGESEAQALRAVVQDANPESMTEAELTAFSEQLATAYAAFRSSFGYLETGKAYRFGNSCEGFEGITIADNGTGSYLSQTTETWSDNAWEVTKSTINEDYTQTVQLKNLHTGRYFGTAATALSGKVAYPVSVSASAGDIVCAFSAETGDFTVSSNGKNLYPIPETSTSLPGIISSGSSINGQNAIRLVGGAWSIEQVYVMTYNCVDESGNSLGSFRTSVPAATAYTYAAPEIKNHAILSYEETGSSEAPVVASMDEHKTATVTYKRSAYAVTTVCRDQTGAYLSVEEVTCPVGSTYTVSLPELKYYTFESADQENGTVLTPESDLAVNATYSTTAYNGVKALADHVTKAESGKSYVIYDTSPVDTERIGYRKVSSALQVMKSDAIEGQDPNHTWLLESSGTGYKVKNAYHGLYVPQLTTNPTPVTLAASGAVFNFTLNSDGETWKIKGTNGVCWDGLGSGALVGWNDPGHPYKLYEYYADPYFTVTVRSVTTEELELATQTVLVKAGEPYVLVTGTHDGYVLKSIAGDNDKLGSVDDHLTVNVIYEKDAPDGIGRIEGTQKRPDAIYDLSGRRLNRIAGRGIYILNEKKVLVK